MRDFATCLSSRLAEAPTAPSGEEVTKGEAAPEAVAAADQPAPPPPAVAKPVGGIGLFFSVLWERIRRRFGRAR
jgi:hypothetical protein